MKLSILIPAYNEERFIQQVLSEIKAIDLSMCGISKKEIILIDDGSTDSTVKKAIMVIPEIQIIRHRRKQGKGAAIASGIPRAKGEIILIQDADLEYRPSLYPRLLEPIIKGAAEVVYGSRFLYHRHPQNMRLVYFLANRFGASLLNLLSGVKLTDPMTCFKVFKKNALESIIIESKGFGVDAELTCKINRMGFKIKEVAIPYRARTFKEGKKFHPLCSINVLRAIIRYS